MNTASFVSGSITATDKVERLVKSILATIRYVMTIVWGGANMRLFSIVTVQLGKDFVSIIQSSGVSAIGGSNVLKVDGDMTGFFLFLFFCV